MYHPEEIKKAKKKVKAKKEFYQHLMSFVIVNTFLLFINLLTSPTSLWFYFPLLGWGVALMFHYVDVFGVPGFDILSQEWEEKELYNELRKNQKNNPTSNNRIEEGKQRGTLELKELRKEYDDSEFV